jgi:hypothetical protein
MLKSLSECQAAQDDRGIRASPAASKFWSGAPPGCKQRGRLNRADRPCANYLRAAQAYMLISMPTGTSTILGVFQVIGFSILGILGATFAPNRK